MVLTKMILMKQISAAGYECELLPLSDSEAVCIYVPRFFDKCALA